MQQPTNKAHAKPVRPTDPDEIADRLAAPFAPEVIAWRAGMVGKNGDSALAMSYIDARDVTKRLDSVLGIHGWKSRHYAIGSTQIACELSIRIAGEWVAATIDYRTLADAKDMNVELGKIVFKLADNLRLKYSVESARAEVLDQIASTYGMVRRPASPLPEPAPPRPKNRFEAIAEELKKL